MYRNRMHRTTTTTTPSGDIAKNGFPLQPNPTHVRVQDRCGTGEGGWVTLDRCQCRGYMKRQCCRRGKLAILLFFLPLCADKLLVTRLGAYPPVPCMSFAPSCTNEALPITPTANKPGQKRRPGSNDDKEKKKLNYKVSKHNATCTDEAFYVRALVLRSDKISKSAMTNHQQHSQKSSDKNHIKITKMRHHNYEHDTH